MSTQSHITPLQKSMQLRARSKQITNSIIIKLSELDTPLLKSYWNTWHCSSTIEQTGNNINGRYCNNRWCLTCNRIRTAKLINGYGDQLKAFKNPMFVTLTAPTVSKDDLPGELKERQEAFRRISKNMSQKKGVPIVGIRKLEVAYNAKTDKFHPHYHLVIDGQITAHILVSLWLDQFPDATRQAQDIRPANADSMNEIFKYVTKLVAKGKKQLAAIDWIYQCTRGKRLVQPYGGIKRVNEDVNEGLNKNCDWKPEGNFVYQWNGGQSDWMRIDGDKLTGYQMDDKTREMLHNILRGNIDITAPDELTEEIKDTVLTDWQIQPVKTTEHDLRQFNEFYKMAERTEPPEKSKPPEQISLFPGSLHNYL